MENKSKNMKKLMNIDKTLDLGLKNYFINKLKGALDRINSGDCLIEKEFFTNQNA